MRKIWTIFIICLMFFIAGCTQESKTKPIVVTTIFPQYDIVRYLAGDNVDLYMAISPGVDTHHYDPSVDDILLIKKCDLFIYTYEEMEPWAVNLKEAKDGEIVLDISTLDGITLKKIEEEEEHDHHHEHEHHHDYDPHLWTSLENLKIMAKGICDALCQIDEKNASTYISNSDKYISEIDKFIVQMEELKELAKDTTYYFASPFAMFYLFDEFDLQYEALYDTCSVEIEPSIDDVINMTKEMEANGVNYIYAKELTQTNMAERIIGNKDNVLIIHSGHNLGKDDFESGKTYFEILQQNIELLKKGVK